MWLNLQAHTSTVAGAMRVLTVDPNVCRPQDADATDEARIADWEKSLRRRTKMSLFGTLI